MTSVDRIQGLSGSQAFKIPCRVATTAPIPAYGLQTIDGVVLAAGDRVLRWSETDETLNGIFEVSTSAWPRTLDADGTYDLLDGTLVVVREGATYAGKIFEIHGTNPILPGTSEITAESVADFTMVTAFARTLLDDIDAAAMRGTLSAAKSGVNTDITSINGTAIPTSETLLVTADIGSSVQAYSTNIPTVAPGTSGNVLTSTGSAWTSAPNAGVTYASSAENAAGAIEDKAVDPLGIREAFNATGDAPVYACRAWVNFNGTGTVAIRGSGNVSSITDNGTGDYTVNLATAMPDANYGVEVSGGSSDAGYTTHATLGTTKTVSAFRVLGASVTATANNLADLVEFNAAIFR